MSERGCTITRSFEAPREVLWEAWTTPEHFARWFGTDAIEMRDVDVDLRPEGEWHGAASIRRAPHRRAARAGQGRHRVFMDSLATLLPGILTARHDPI